jgi:hypothetical protein
MPRHYTPRPRCHELYADRPARVVPGEPRARTHHRELVVMLVDALRACARVNVWLTPGDHLACMIALRGKVGIA